jgi:dephospho-CoA kinase
MIIGITGTLGAGKDETAEYIAKVLKVSHVSGGNTLRELLVKMGLEPKKSVLGPFGEFLRNNYGGDTVAKLALEHAEDTTGAVYSGFRSLPEAQAVKDRGGIIIYVDAPAAIRHKRIISRLRAGDTATSEELTRLDRREQDSGIAMGENLVAVKALVDVTIINDGTRGELYRQLDDVCAKLTHVN